jgi:hypothetical protein
MSRDILPDQMGNEKVNGEGSSGGVRSLRSIGPSLQGSKRVPLPVLGARTPVGCYLGIDQTSCRGYNRMGAFHSQDCGFWGRDIQLGAGLARSAGYRVEGHFGVNYQVR